MPSSFAVFYYLDYLDISRISRVGRELGPSMGWLGFGSVGLGHKFAVPLWVGFGYFWSNVMFLWPFWNCRM